uniref:Uncharacterized protein n=1 Tax=Oryza meridionalis TaxID=40149 RepID=A0A0E0CKN5_9ORYZ
MVAVVAGAPTTTTTALVGVCARVGRRPPPRLWWLKATGCLSSHRTIRGGLLLSFGTNGQSASSIPSPPNIQLYETLSGVLLPSSSLSLHVSKETMVAESNWLSVFPSHNPWWAAAFLWYKWAVGLFHPFPSQHPTL